MTDHRNESTTTAPPPHSTTDESAIDESEHAYLAQLSTQPLPSRLKGYVKLSGPGWLQSAITLGGGSLASSLYLGVLAGFSLMWLQPLAMILGIIMLSAIGYVTLSTGERPFRAINEHVNPVLGWGWALAVAAANIVWCLPQYALAHGVLTQNLLPNIRDRESLFSQVTATTLGPESWWAVNAEKLLVVTLILVISTVITWNYDRGGRGLRLYENMLKTMVALIVLCFFGVVIVMSLSDNPLDWNAIATGLVPDFGQFFKPAATFLPLLEEIGPEGDAARQFWSDKIVSEQRDVMISAAATAVGINMTFLFPYSLLRKRWTREYRGLAVFDLSTGMFIPYILATGCVVIAASAQFHTNVADGFAVDGNSVVAPDKFAGAYNSLLKAREAQELEPAEIGVSEKKLAATLVRRDAMDLAKSLQPLTGNFVANIVFGLGVLAMTLSTISILMLISGFVFAELLGFPPGGWGHRGATLVAGVGGALGPFVWSDASFYLAVPTSVFGFVLLPFAYVTFVLLMNQRSLLGDDVPKGFKRFAFNLLTGIAALVASVGSVYMIWVKASWVGIAAVTAFILLALMVQINRYNESRYA